MKKSQDAHEVVETEEQLINRAQEAVSQCRWIIGECASKWTKRFARGRTDADFAALLGLTGDQVFQRRRVWEKFSGSREQFPSLRWSHYYSALSWDDGPECLGWAEETHSTVAEMRAWRRARRGEDLTTDALPDEEFDQTISFVPTETDFVQDPSAFGKGKSKPGTRPASAGDPDQMALAGVARQMEHGGDDYTPFRKQAGSAAPKEAGDATAVAPPRVAPDQLVKRLTSTIERCVKVLTPEFTREFRKLPEPLRNRFIKVVGELSSKAGDMM